MHPPHLASPRREVAVSARERLPATGANGPLMARVQCIGMPRALVLVVLVLVVRPLRKNERVSERLIVCGETSDMPRVIMQPSFGHGAPQERWKRTLETEIPFTAHPYVDGLRPGDLDRLLAMHPAGAARFWGATKVQNKNYDTKVSAGDVVLFTGAMQVRAVGQIGVILRDAAGFGDLLWDPEPKNGSWCNVYSVQGFQKVAIPYQTIWALPGFQAKPVFQGLWPLDSDRSQTLLEALHIEPPETPQPDAEEHRRLAALAKSMGQVTAAEEFTKASTSYEQAAGTVIVNRAESLLITAYRASLPAPTIRPSVFRLAWLTTTMQTQTEASSWKQRAAPSTSLSGKR